MDLRRIAKRVLPPIFVDAYRMAIGRNLLPPSTDYFDTLRIGGRAVRLGAEFSLPSTYLFFGGMDSTTHEMDCFVEATKGRTRLLDVGAAFGAFSLAFSIIRGGECLAVDASPAMLPQLRTNLAFNPDLPIRPVLVALSNRDGHLDMHFEGLHAAALGAGEQPEITVRCSTGTRLCADQNFDPDTIKVDVEGHEIEVLEGLLPMLMDGRDRLIFLEVHPTMIREAGRSHEELMPLLAKAGYLPTDLEGRPLSSLGEAALGSITYHTVWTRAA